MNNLIPSELYAIASEDLQKEIDKELECDTQENKEDEEKNIKENKNEIATIY